MKLSKVVAATVLVAGVSCRCDRFSRSICEDGTLANVRRTDSRDSSNNLVRLSPGEHLRRASVYMSNRAFEEARELAGADFLLSQRSSRGGSCWNWQVVPAVAALCRSIRAYDQLFRRFSSTKEGREGLNFNAAALVAHGQARRSGRKICGVHSALSQWRGIDTAHLNIIDTLREAVAQKKRLPGSREPDNVLPARLQKRMQSSRDCGWTWPKVIGRMRWQLPMS